MEEQLISFETAKSAKEKRFNISSNQQKGYNKEGVLTFCGYSMYCNNEDFEETNLYSAPTQSLLQKWLRERYDIFVETQTYIADGLFKHMFIIKTTMDYEIDVRDSGNNFPSIEKALEQGLQEALKQIPQS